MRTARGRRGCASSGCPAWAGNRDRLRIPTGTRQVLLLYAESRLLPAVVEVDAAFRSTVASSLGRAGDLPYRVPRSAAHAKRGIRAPPAGSRSGPNTGMSTST